MISRKARVVDGYTTLKAVQRRVGPHAAPPERAEIRVLEPVRPPPAAHIGHTVLPTKYAIVCYDCGFEFNITGKARDTYCPKCRSRLDLTDHVLTGTVKEEIVTAGRIVLSKGAILDGGTLTGNIIFLNGTVRSGHVKACYLLEIGAGAVVKASQLDALNLCIAHAATYRFVKPVQFRNVEIHGHLRASLAAQGLVAVYPEGHFTGSLRAGHLIVHEGGGLSADVCLTPDGPADLEDGDGVS